MAELDEQERKAPAGCCPCGWLAEDRVAEAPLFEFVMRMVSVPREQLYVAWTGAKQVSARGATAAEAQTKVAAMLGAPPHGDGWEWRFLVDGIREVSGG